MTEIHRRNAKEANCEPSGIRVKVGLNGRYKLLNKYATVASVSVRRGSTGKVAHPADVAVISLSGGVGSALPPWDARPRSTDLGPLASSRTKSIPVHDPHLNLPFHPLPPSTDFVQHLSQMTAKILAPPFAQHTARESLKRFSDRQVFLHCHFL